MGAIVVSRARRDTPGCAGVTHLNNAGASLPTQQVLDAVIDHLRLEAQIGGYEAADRAASRIDRGYGAVAELLHCAPEEIALCESATVAFDRAFQAVPLHRGDRVLVGQGDYASNSLTLLARCQRIGAKVEVVPDDEHGQTSVAALHSIVEQHAGRVKLIALTHVPSNGGLVNPAAAIGAIARTYGITYLLDACQSVGQMPINVDEIGCDLLSFTGRKYLRAPRGTGALYVRQSVLDHLEPSTIDLRGATWTAADRFELRPDARRFETFESSVAARIGLGVAIDYALRLGLDQIEERITALAVLLRDALEEVPGVVVRDLGERRCGIVTFTLDGWDPDDIRRSLQRDKINVSVTLKGSTLLDMTTRGLDAMVRASVHYYNTEDEIERFVMLVHRLASAARAR